jgi:hypothetical protein
MLAVQIFEMKEKLVPLSSSPEILDGGNYCYVKSGKIYRQFV